jgi:hypothetical protein
MVMIAEFEVASTEDIPGETKFARLRRIARETRRPPVKVTSYYVPKGSPDADRFSPVSLREASDIMLARISPVMIAAMTSVGIGANVT